MADVFFPKRHIALYYLFSWDGTHDIAGASTALKPLSYRKAKFNSKFNRWFVEYNEVFVN